MRSHSVLKNLVFLIAASVGLAACGSGGASYSLLSEEAAFRQTTQTIKAKLDILWVIDNSGSMQTSQDELAREFPIWFQAFDANDYDYRVAVGATDAWRTHFNQGSSYSRLRDGSSSQRSGVYIIDPTTPDRENIFSVNARLGINGSGDERSFQSMEQILKNQSNAAFRRSDAMLNVIIVTDEDDTSWDQSNSVSYTDSRLHPISKYVTSLHNLTKSTAEEKNYIVHSLTIKDSACSNSQGGRPHGTRVMNLAAATGGISMRLCDSFAQSMAQLSANVQAAVQDTFQLDRIPIVESIVVRINGVIVPNNGWTYSIQDNSVTILDPHKPEKSDTITIGYDPAGVK